MHRPIFTIWLAIVLLAPAGCYLPLSKDIVSEQEIGVRSAGSAGGRATIVRRVVKQYVLSPLTEQGYGKDYLLWNQYYLKSGSEETRLEFLEIGMIEGMKHAAQKTAYPLREIEPDVRVVEGTTSWVVIRFRRVVREYLDLEVIVFDESLHPRMLVVEGIQRRRWSTRNFLGNLEFGEGNKRIILHKDEGRLALNLPALTLEKL